MWIWLAGNLVKRRNWVCLVVRLSAIWAGLGSLAGGRRVAGTIVLSLARAIALPLAVGIGFVWYPRLAALGGVGAEAVAGQDAGVRCECRQGSARLGLFGIFVLLAALGWLLGGGARG